MNSTLTANEMLFLGGLHRSGTSLIFQCLRDHPQISGFNDTGAPEDEGQHLQSVYPRAALHGGPGLFGYAPQLHLTEDSLLVRAENRHRLFSDWRPFWDLSRPYLMEKTPQNLIQSRFLQALFPDARFLMVMRHPLAVAYATRKWSHTSLYSLIEHWLHCHELFAQDRPHLARAHVVRYEDFVERPEQSLREIYEFLDLDFHPATAPIRGQINEKYLARWKRDRAKLLTGRYLDHLVTRLSSRLEHFGYEFPPAEDRAVSWLAADQLSGAISLAYRGLGAVQRVVSRGYKGTRKRLRATFGLSRKRTSAVY